MSYSEFEGNLGITDLTILAGNSNLPADMPYAVSPDQYKAGHGIVDLAVLNGNSNLPADLAYTNFVGPNEFDDLASYDEYSNLFGRRRSRRSRPRRRSGSSRPRRRSRRSGGGNFASWAKRTFTTPEGRERRARRRSDKRQQEQQAMAMQKNLMQQQQADQGSTAAILQAINQPSGAAAGTAAGAANTNQKKKLTGLQWTLIALGGAAVIGVTIFAIRRTMKNKGKKAAK